MQIIHNDIKALGDIIEELGCQKILLVCDKSFEFLSFASYIESLKDRYIIFSGFGSNPLVEDAQKGVELLIANNCDCIVAVGGGSTLDVAKYIKLKGNQSLNLIAIPTTAGTGSESTRHIVVYKDGVKQSIPSETVIPNYVILDASVLETLPPYQKVCTALDAFFQGIESYWSVNATIETRKISGRCIHQLSTYLETYFNEGKNRRFNVEVAQNVMDAANLSGRAIDLTQTTAGHAMSYKLSSMFGIPHGHAVAICMFELWNYSIQYVKQHKLDSVKNTMLEICSFSEYKTLQEFSNYLHAIIYTYGELWNPVSKNYDKDIETLVSCVKPERLKNNPIAFDENDLRNMYKKIVTQAGS